MDAATEQEVAALRQAVETRFRQHRQTLRHDCAAAVLTLDVDRSPVPASRRSEGSTRGSMGRSRSRTGRTLVRVRAAPSQETVWEDVLEGRAVERWPVVQAVVEAVERRLGLAGEGPEVAARRARVEWRLDSGWGSEEASTWLLGRGDHVTGTFTSSARVQQLVKPITAWEPTSSPGRAVAPGPEPVALVRPCAQDAGRTPSKEQAGGSYHAVLFRSRTELDMQAVVDHDDGRAGREADLKSDQRGVGLAVLRQHKLAAQQVVVRLMELAHNVLLWSRRWLQQPVPRLARLGSVRRIQEVWAVPGRVNLADDRLTRVRLNPDHPRARDVCRGLRPLLPAGAPLGFLG